MKTAVQHLVKLSKDDKLRMIAEAREKENMDRYSSLKNSYDEGWEKGMQKGRQEGRQERNRVILNMLKKEMDISFIAEVTGLSKEEIKKLKNGSCSD